MYDSKSDMHYLKSALEKLGIGCKVVGEDGFWESREVRDLFCCLQCKALVRREKFDGFYATGALQSKVFDMQDKEIYDIVHDKEIEKIKELFDPFSANSLHQLARSLFVKSRAYLRYENPYQAKANIEELIREIIRLEREYDFDEDRILKTLEKNFFFGSKQNAFYDAPGANSIVLSSIHFTKGLDYPMIILARADKRLKPYNEEGIIFQKYSDLRGNERFVVGFKIDDYKPLAYRVANEIDQLKYHAEKKRLLYVALTRAKHSIVISSVGEGSEKSFIGYMKKHLDNLPKVTMPIENFEGENVNAAKVDIDFRFDEKGAESVQLPSINHSARLGEAVHKIIELYWDRLDNEELIEKVLFAYGVQEQRDSIAKMLDRFRNSSIYRELLEADERYFEFGFEMDGEYGRIDLLYRIENKWKIVDFKTGKTQDFSQQLQGYEEALEALGMKNVQSQILYLGA